MFCNNEEIYVNDQSCATMTSTDNLTYKDCQCFRISILFTEASHTGSKSSIQPNDNTSENCFS